MFIQIKFVERITQLPLSNLKYLLLYIMLNIHKHNGFFSVHCAMEVENIKFYQNSVSALQQAYFTDLNAVMSFIIPIVIPRRYTYDSLFHSICFLNICFSHFEKARKMKRSPDPFEIKFFFYSYIIFFDQFQNSDIFYIAGFYIFSV